MGKVVSAQAEELDIRKHIIYHKNKWLSKSLRAFIEYVKEKEFG